MDTLSQIIVAVLLSVLLGIPLGVLSARHRWLEQLLRPILDFLQTIPAFVFLVPVIMLFNLGRVPGIIGGRGRAGSRPRFRFHHLAIPA